MQVEKRHYAINLLLLIALYLSFLPEDIPYLRLLIIIILNTLLYNRVFLHSKVKLIMIFGSLFEIMSSGVIGIFYMNYLIIKNIVDYARERLKNINTLEVFIITSLAIGISTFIEVLIKKSLGFPMSDIQYEFTAIASIISTVIIYISKRP
jgi:hypothetical protein